ncbi:MAG: hypothetical protein P8J59_11320 [Phycisphaerales bacterium]|jgi:hypothetical protein|nr:hypothetical protein [Phycisphaerales bacterium]
MSLMKSISMAGIAIAGFAVSFPAVANASDNRVPVVYVVPMNGQMGTDIHPSIYDKVIEDAMKVKPDVIVYQLKSADIDKNFYLAGNDDRREFGMAKIGEYRDLARALHQKLDARQVMWVEDSVGLGSLLALSWPEMYMSEGARLWGLSRVSMMAAGWSDPDVASKMLNAWVGMGNGFLQLGGYPLEIGWAMMRPEYALSASFKGRKVTWANDTSGQWVVDSNDERVANFSATLAEDMGLSEGTVENLDDLMFLLGYREYDEVESGKEMVEKYVEDWRRTFDRCKAWYADAQQKLGWASGDDAIRYLGAAKTDLERILRACKQYPAVAARWQQDYGMSILQLELQIEGIKDQIGDMRRGNRGSGRRGGNSGRGGGGGRGL